MLIRFRDFMNTLIDLTQKALNAIGKLLGWQIEIEEVGVSMDDGIEDYVDSLDDAVGAAKKLNAQLRSIDEVNNLTSSDNNGGSGAGSGISGVGGGSSGATGGGWRLEQYESDIDSWYDLGKRISEKIRDGLKSIDWDEIKRKATEFSHNLAEFLNGLIQPDTFRSFGSTLAQSLNTVIESALEFGKTFNFTNFGVSLAQAFNGFFADWNANEAAELINTWADGLWEAIKAFFAGDEDGNGGLDWPLISNKFDEFFETLDATNFIDGLQDVWEGANVYINPFKFFLPKDEREWMDQSAKDKLKEGVEQLWKWYFDERNLYSPFSVIQLAGGLEFDPELIESNGGWGEFAKKIMEQQGKYIGEPIAETIAETISIAIQTLTETWGNLKTWFTDNIATPISEAFTNSWATVTETWGNIQTWFDENVKTPIVNTFTNIITAIDEKTLWIRQVIESIGIIMEATWMLAVASFKQNVVTPIISHFETLWASVQSIWGVVTTWFQSYVITPFVTNFTELISKVQNGFTTLWDKIRSAWEKASNWFNATVIVPIISHFTNLKTKASDSITSLWDDIKSVWSKVSEWFGTYVISPLTDSFSYLWASVVSGMKDGLNAGISVIEDFINLIIDGINAFTEKLSLIAKAASYITKDDYSGITTIQHITLNRFEKGGFPQTGSLFFAGEAGAELLGSVNGRTTVASNGEITGISDTIRQTSSEEIALLRQQNQLLQGILQKEFGISNGDIFRSVRTSASEYTKMTGNPAFA